MTDFIKSNNIVKNYLLEESNRINILKYKIEEKFPLIHYIYLLLLRKIYNRTNNFRIQNKNDFDFYFHLHHSHTTGKIFGYAHEFCNTTLVEKSTPEISFVAHYFFGFDLFY